MKKKKILVACEYSGTVRDAFIAKGHDAISCDLEPTDSPGPHYQGDIMDILYDNWDMIIAFPPCTYTSNVGAKHLFPNGVLNEDRYKKGIEGKEFFMKFYNHPCEQICIENPRPSKIFRFPQSSDSFQPKDFGHPYTKKTLLWLKNLPPLMPTGICEEWESTCTAAWFNNGGKDRQKRRARFWNGVAQAMAEQWG